MRFFSNKNKDPSCEWAYCYIVEHNSYIFHTWRYSIAKCPSLASKAKTTHWLNTFSMTAILFLPGDLFKNRWEYLPMKSPSFSRYGFKRFCRRILPSGGYGQLW